MTTHLQSPIHLQLPLSGMSCANCAGRITAAPNKPRRVSATVNFALEQAAIELASPDRLPAVLESIQAQGYDYGSETILFQITGMTCAGCFGPPEQDAGGAARRHLRRRQLSPSSRLVSCWCPDADARGPARADRRLGFGAQLAQGSASGAPPAVAGAGSAGGRQRPSGANPVIVLALCHPAAAGGMLAMAGLFPGICPPGWSCCSPPRCSSGSGPASIAAPGSPSRTAPPTWMCWWRPAPAPPTSTSLYLLLDAGDAASGQLYFEASAIIITLISLKSCWKPRARRSTQSAIRELMALRPKPPPSGAASAGRASPSTRCCAAIAAAVLVGNGCRWMAES